MEGDVAALRAGLAALAHHEMPEATDVGINSLERVGSGNSSENWFFQACWRRGGREERHELVLRRTPNSEIVRNSRIDEFLLLKALDDTGLPVPRVFWIDRDGRWLGRPAVVLARCPGRDDRSLLLPQGKAGLHESQRVAIAAEMVNLLAAIHSLDVRTLELPSSIRREQGHPARIELDRQERAALDDEIAPCIELRAAAWWLRDNLPSRSPREVLVHGDFRPANLLVEDGRVTALLDWEFAHVGDPAEDLGWYLAPRYSREHFIRDRFERSDFIAAYQRAIGAILDPAAIRWWSIFAQYKLCAMVLASIRAFIDGDAQRIALWPKAMLDDLLRAIDLEASGGL